MTTGSQGTSESSEQAPHRAFVTTHWSLVLSARDRESPQSAAALEKLCRAYWFPLYAFVRRSGHSKEDAEDLTQAFFARLLEKNFLDAAQRERGRFRTFLLVALKRFMANEWDRARAQKRGGFHTHIPLDTALAERKFQSDISAHGISPDRAYERRWALTLLEQTMSRLRLEFEQAGKISEFENLKKFLTADKKEISHATAAADRLAPGPISEGALRVAVHRLRRRYREMFREEIAHTLAEGESVDEELRYLLGVLSN